MRKTLLLFVLFAACVAASYPQAHAEPAGQAKQAHPGAGLPDTLRPHVPDTAVTVLDTAQQAVPDTARTQPYKIVPDTVTLCYYPRMAVWDSIICELYHLINDTHPDMFAFTPKETFEKRFMEIDRTLPDSLTAYQAYSYIAPLVALVGEAHTNATPPWDIYLAHNPYWLPAYPYIDKKDLKIKLADAPFEYSEIVGINGRANRDMVDQLLSYCGSETLHGKIKIINGRMPLHFALVDSSSVFRIDYVGKDSALHSAELEGVRIKEHQRRIGFRNDDLDYIVSESDDPSKFRFSRVEPSTVLLSMPSFDEEEAPPVIDSMFAYIKSEPKVKNLVIDLRGNLGGMGFVITHLLKYLSPEEFADYTGGTNGGYLVEETKVSMPGTATPYSADERFRGDLYVLIDNGCFSASTIFSHLVKRGRLGTLVGEQTGGSVFTHGISGTFTINPCGLEIDCASAILWLPDLEHYRRTMEPVYPDIEVPSAEALDKALELIASGGGCD